MQTDQILSFGPYSLDLAGVRLWRGKQEVRLTGKAFAVLRYLATHAGALVTKDELLQAVWPETVVSEAALTSCIKELREVLRDQAQERRYIETVHRRGFRFIGQLRDLEGQTKTPPETVHRQSVDEVKEVERKLVAILSADVQGYSRLMSEDEVGTIRTLTTYREVMTALIQQHRGRVVDSPGDNLLAEFASAVDAVQCAVEIQQALAAKNADLPAERQMAFRIGINVGDVVVEGAQLYGEGVNIAARLEGLAEAGGLCISGTVYDQIKTKVALAYEDLGARVVKNIAEPVRVYRVQWEPEVYPAQSPAPLAQQGLPELQPPPRPPGARRSPLPEPSPLVLGRAAELSQLAGYWEKALRGERQLVFVAGEAGIGKTTLVEAFLHQSAATDECWLGRGQCIEHYGAGEAYLPLLEALGRLGREAGGQRLLALLRQQAPSWLVQLPALLTAPELDRLQRQTQGVTRERMLRELAEAVEQLTAERPLVLWLEDLHWSDVSTLDWLAYTARRREPARLLVLGTYRPVDVLVQGHPLRAMQQELQTHGYCAELVLDFLSAAEVAEYLAVRFRGPSRRAREARPEHSRRGQAGGAVGPEHERRPSHPGPLAPGARDPQPAAFVQPLARALHRRTDGNPLFMVTVVNDLVARGVLVQSAGRWELQGSVAEEEGRVPESLRQLIGQQLARLQPEGQRLLEVASVAGAEFSAAVVAAGLELAGETVEEQCEELARREHFLRARGTAEWPDGTVAARYGFLHALYQEVLYERVPVGRRARLHRRIGERGETAYGARAREIAAELALHFERGRDYRRAIHYLQQAGENAIRRSAYREAISLLTRGLELLKTLPDAPERTQQELALHFALGGSLMATKGFSAPEVEQAYGRARELCRQVGETPQLFQALYGLFVFYETRAEHHTTLQLGEQLLTLAQSLQDPAALGWAHHGLGLTLFWRGEIARAHAHQEQGLAFYDPQQHNPYSPSWPDFRVVCLSYATSALSLLGYPDQALRRVQEALALAQKLSHPFSLAYALSSAAGLHSFHGEGHAAQERAEALITLSAAQGLPLFVAIGTFMRGWALAQQGQVEEGIAQMQQGLAVLRAIGAEQGQTSRLGWLAAAYAKVGQVEEGLSVVAEALALVDQTGERVGEAGLYRLKGELMLQEFRVQGSKFKVSNTQHPTPSPQAEAEACFHKAIEIARRQSAKSLELRATISLARLWQRQGKQHEARNTLSEIYGWFTEGFETKDLQEAKALLAELS